MFKKIIVSLLLVGLVVVLLVGAVNRTMARTDGTGSGLGNGRQGASLGDDDTTTQGSGSAARGWGNGAGSSTGGGQVLSTEENSLSAGGASNYGAGQNNGLRQGWGLENSTYQPIPAGQADLSEAEQEALIFMREEEKLAHDVYQQMYDLWGTPIFNNIRVSEQTHAAAVETLLARYDIPDPASEEIGVFTNPDLQALYDDLVAQGSQSLSSALQVGAAIEEIDILDLQERLAQTDNTEVQNVFTSLLNGSYNHLNAFSSILMAQTGEDYQPQFMSQDEYQAIIESSAGIGGQGQGAQRGRGGRW